MAFEAKSYFPFYPTQIVAQKYLNSLHLLSEQLGVA